MPRVYHFREWYDQWFPGGVYGKSRGDFVDLYFLGGTALYKSRPLYTVFWSFVEANSGDVADIDVPMFHVTGWYDHETDQTLREMQDIQTMGGPNARGNQRIIIGPWTHEGLGAIDQGELSYPSAEWGDSLEGLAFFDHVLRGMNNGFLDRPAYLYYRMNAGEWIESDTFPPAEAVNDVRYLTPGGTLSETAPTTPDAALRYMSDPSDPVPTLFGAVIGLETSAHQGPGDLAGLLARQDVLSFVTEPLSKPLVIEGWVSARLFITCTAVDTDFSVRLVDHYPDGRVMLLVDGIRRASLRDNYETRQLLSGSVVYEIPVSLPPVSVEFPAGHRLGILVAPSNFDRFDKNMQDGSDLSDQDGAVATTAEIALHVNPDYPSSITLPVVPPESELDADVDDNGRVDAVDLQYVVNGALGIETPGIDTDIDLNGHTDAADVQFTVNAILGMVA
jgi:putative CocE/NonD family hydrolase